MTVWKLARLLAGTVATIAIVGVIVAAVALALGHRGYRAYAMQTASMAPHIKPGDLVVVRAVSPYEIHPGDVISFQSPLAPIQVTHRVEKVDYTSTGPVFTTKGDANGNNDPWLLRYQGSGWEVTSVIPHVAGWLARLTGSGGRIVIAAVLFLVVLIILLPSAKKADSATPLQAVA